MSPSGLLLVENEKQEESESKTKLSYTGVTHSTSRALSVINFLPLSSATKLTLSVATEGQQVVMGDKDFGNTAKLGFWPTLNYSLTAPNRQLLACPLSRS